MEPERFCAPCDFRGNCPVAEFYSKKGFCCYASIKGEAVLMDCFSVHFGESSYPREVASDKDFLALAFDAKKQVDLERLSVLH